MVTTKAVAKSIPEQLREATTPLAKLRVPFPDNQIGNLPRAVNKQDTEKYGCKPGTKASVDGIFCGGYHTRSVHLSFVGHAALTDRLLDADPEWTWEPLAVDEYGMPKYDQFGGLWIRLTVAGVSRLGYGDAQGKPAGTTAVKEIIGDALRNAGMRFGMALDLWHKGDLHDTEEEQGKLEEQAATPSEKLPPVRDFLLEAVGKDLDGTLALWRDAKRDLGPSHATVKVLADQSRRLKDEQEAAAGVTDVGNIIPTEPAPGVDAVRAAFGGAKEVKE